MSYESFIRPGEAIQPAIDRASQQGGGKVSLLPGTHRTGTLYLKSNVELFLACGAVLEGGHTEAEYDALPDPLFAECHTDAHNRALLAAANAENIALTGYGVIEGNGPDFYEKKILPCGFYQRKQVERPRMLHFANCRNIRIENLHFHNSPRWTMWFIQCCDLVIRGVEIFGDPRMINNDGIHFFGGRNLMVSDCRISTGDDALVVRAGHAWHANTNRVILEDLVVTNCVLESACQAIRVGCPGDDLIRNCRFSNLVLKGKNGIFLTIPVATGNGNWQLRFGRVRMKCIIWHSARSRSRSRAVRLPSRWRKESRSACSIISSFQICCWKGENRCGSADAAHYRSAESY